MNEKNEYIKGVKIHNKTGALHLFGFVNAKRIIKPVVYPTRKRQDLTAAKEAFRKMLPAEKFRQFILTGDRLDEVNMENLKFNFSE